MDIQPKAHILTQRAGTYTFILMKAPSDITCTHLHCLLPCPSSWSRGHSVLRAMLACPCNTLVLNGKGEMKKKKSQTWGRGVLVVMVAALPARQSAQQPEHLAISKGPSCGLYLWGLCLRPPDGHLWKIFTTEAATATPSSHITMTKDR